MDLNSLLVKIPRAGILQRKGLKVKGAIGPEGNLRSERICISL